MISYHLQNKKDSTNLLETTFVWPGEDFSANIIQVTSEFIGRPDLLSKEVYGSEEYAGIICKVNGISNPIELNKDMLIALPAPDILDKFVVQESLDEVYWSEPENQENGKNGSTGNSNTNKKYQLPTPKTSTDKNRRPNEALATDKRFNIDKISKRVVY